MPNLDADLAHVFVLQVGSSLREGLLLGVVEHLLSIDADIKWQEIVDAPTGASIERCCSSSRFQHLLA
jgi:hypothetical protein